MITWVINMYINIEFQEEYKRLDRLCKDCLNSKEGVSEYIRQMETTPIRDRNYVPTWNEDYKQLKHARWIRNQLSHEVGTLECDFCTDEELGFVIAFYNRILRGDDPFSIIQRSTQFKQKHYSNQSSKQDNSHRKEETKKASENKLSIFDWIRKIFFGQ